MIVAYFFLVFSESNSTQHWILQAWTMPYSNNMILTSLLQQHLTERCEHCLCAVYVYSSTTKHPAPIAARKHTSSTIKMSTFVICYRIKCQMIFTSKRHWIGVNLIWHFWTLKFIYWYSLTFMIVIHICLFSSRFMTLAIFMIDFSL